MPRSGMVFSLAWGESQLKKKKTWTGLEPRVLAVELLPDLGEHTHLSQTSEEKLKRFVQIFVSSMYVLMYVPRIFLIFCQTVKLNSAFQPAKTVCEKKNSFRSYFRSKMHRGSLLNATLLYISYLAQNCLDLVETFRK